jgi:ABC-type amino acid transport substrate-binding protein
MLAMNSKLPTHKMIIVVVCGIVAVGISMFAPVDAFSQDDSVTSRILLVGTMVAPPFSQKTADGRWEGFSIELWQAVAQRLGVSFELREYESFGALLDELEKGAIDVLPWLNINEKYEDKLDFCHSYLRTGLAIAVPAESSTSSWLRITEFLYSEFFLKAIAFLIGMSLVAGIVVWSFERRRNPEMFGGETAEGIGHAVWWAVVTLTTVGYGDKAPQTIAGRIVATFWMFSSIVFISMFTAHITASLTISELRGKVRGFHDLPQVRVGSLAQAEAFNFLSEHGIAAVPFLNIQQGLAAVSNQEIDAFVLNEAILKHLVRSDFAGRVQVIPGDFDHYFVSMAIKNKSPLRKPINKALLKFMDTEDWTGLLKRYFD